MLTYCSASWESQPDVVRKLTNMTLVTSSLPVALGNKRRKLVAEEEWEGRR